MVWGTYSEKMVKKNGKNGKMVKSRLKKVPQSARLSAGGGGEMLFGQCPHGGGDKLKGASLSLAVNVPFFMMTVCSPITELKKNLEILFFVFVTRVPKDHKVLLLW